LLGAPCLECALSLPKNQDSKTPALFFPSLSISPLSFLLHKKRAVAFVWRESICLLIICALAEKDLERTVQDRKIAAFYEAFVSN